MDDVYYRGDTFIFPFGFENENKEPIKYEAGDILKCGLKRDSYTSEYILFKKLEVKEETAEIIFEFSAEETKNARVGTCLLELEHTRNNIVSTVYQEEIEIKGDVVRNESNT